MFRHAIVRPPGANFAEGLTRVDLGKPSFEKALAQHELYCQALAECGLALTRLPVDPRHPDAPFIEDTAVLTARGAILARPGAQSRTGEVGSAEAALAPFFPTFERILAPGTLDGGDICEAGDHFFIGISRRTNEAGAQQFARLLAWKGFTSSLIDIRQTGSILHLKSGIAWLSGRNLVVIDELAGDPALSGWDRLPVDPSEAYAANCVQVNDAVFVASGFPRIEKAVQDLGLRTVALAMSEFQKMDGGLSCLSLRF